MNILSVYQLLSANEGLTTNQTVLGTILGGVIPLPPAPIEYTQLREQFNLTAMPVLNAILNPLAELHARLDINGIVESAFSSFQFRYSALHDFKSLLVPSTELCNVVHTKDYPWATAAYDAISDVLNDYVVQQSTPEPVEQ